MVIRYISAGDRVNYGDFLFPIIFDKYFSKKYLIKYYGIVESDYTSFGAFPTRSYLDLIKDVKNNEDTIVMGGGAIFFSRWRDLYSYINPIYSLITKNRLLNRIDKLLKVNKIFFFQTKNDFPFVPNFECKTIYISVGGAFNSNQNNNDRDYIKKQLNKSTSLSVRDKRTFKSLKDNGIVSEIIPDTAVLISKVFKEEVIRNNIKLIEVKRSKNQKYMLLQLCRYKGPKDLYKFVNDVNLIAHKYNLKVICCPIGYALGHEDHIILKKLCKIDSTWEFIPASNIYEIMYLISNAEFFMGTSLHGLITAFSFLKPAIALNENVLKIDSFIETWCSEFYSGSIDYNELNIKAEYALNKWDRSKAQSKLLFCQDKVEEYFHKLKDYFDI